MRTVEHVASWQRRSRPGLREVLLLLLTLLGRQAVAVEPTAAEMEAAPLG